MRKVLAKVVAAAGCAIVFGAWASEPTIYKSVQPDGSVVYGDAPIKGAVRNEKIKVQTDTIGTEADVAAARRTLEANRKQMLQDFATRDARRHKLDMDIADARRRLEDSEAAREVGKVVKAGDRQGNRLTQKYWDRQRSLGVAVRQARTNLDRLIAERNNLR